MTAIGITLALVAFFAADALLYLGYRIGRAAERRAQRKKGTTT